MRAARRFGGPENEGQAMTDDEIEEVVRELIEVHLDEQARKAALEWFEKCVRVYRAVVGLGGLVGNAD